MSRSAFIAGVSGLELTDCERDFYKEACPLGLILFARNLEHEEQIKKLIGDVRKAVGEDRFWVLIDQEGGRVQRLRPPLFPTLPAARRFGALYETNPVYAVDAARFIGQFMGRKLLELGFNVNCTPVLDTAQPGAHEIISDRSFGTDVDMVAELGRAIAEGHMATGVLPVIKHIPGHGRANADSHLALPEVTAPLDILEAEDFEPFRQLSDLPLAMTAHIVYDAIDKEQPVSTSPIAIEQIIREKIGFDGFLMCDDVSMKALSGPIGARVEAVMTAGCDGALHCNGDLDEMIEVANACPGLSEDGARRFEASFDLIEEPQYFNEKHALRYLSEAWCQGEV